MDFKKISETVSEYSPLLASVVTEANPIAGLIVMAIAKMFNTTSDSDDIVSKIKNDPDAQLKIKQLEQEHEDALMQNQVEDTINARTRETEITRITGKRDWVIGFLTVIVVFGFFTLCILNYFVQGHDNNIIIMQMDQISSGFMLCLGYFFGSSKQ